MGPEVDFSFFGSSLFMTESLKDVAFGALSGIAGKLVEFPFDTIKVRLQSSEKFGKMSTFQTIKLTYQQEGFLKGFYQGIRAPMVGACLETSILFTSYNSALKAFGKLENGDIPLKYKCISGAFAGFIGSFVLAPVELIKCQLQVTNLVDGGKHNHLYSAIIKRIWQKDGLLGFWKGLSSTLLREVNGTAIWFGTYELCSERLKKTNLQPDLSLLISGALSGVVFNTVTYPIDTIKSNIQTHDVLHQSARASFLEIAKNLGIRNLYNGLTITMVRSIPANAIIFYTYETLKTSFS